MIPFRAGPIPGTQPAQNLALAHAQGCFQLLQMLYVVMWDGLDLFLYNGNIIPINADLLIYLLNYSLIPSRYAQILPNLTHVDSK